MTWQRDDGAQKQNSPRHLPELRVTHRNPWGKTYSCDLTEPAHWQFCPPKEQKYGSKLSARRERLSGQSNSAPPESPWQVSALP